jgi:hypothetical protein
MPGVRLVAVSDVVEPKPLDDAPLDGVEVFSRHEELLAGVAADAVVICTPPHTHLPIALDVLDGRDRPAAREAAGGEPRRARRAGRRRRRHRARRAGELQALGSYGWTRSSPPSPQADLVEVRSIGVAGTWWRHRRTGPAHRGRESAFSRADRWPTVRCSTRSRTPSCRRW